MSRFCRQRPALRSEKFSCRHQHRHQRSTIGSEPIFNPWRLLTEILAFNQMVALQLPQMLSEHFLRDPRHVPQQLRGSQGRLTSVRRRAPTGLPPMLRGTTSSGRRCLCSRKCRWDGSERSMKSPLPSRSWSVPEAVISPARISGLTAECGLDSDARERRARPRPHRAAGHRSPRCQGGVEYLPSGHRWSPGRTASPRGIAKSP